jgi:hypothetical protein
VRYRLVLDVLGRHWVLPPDVSRQFNDVIFKVPKSIRSLERRDKRCYQKFPEIPVLQAVYARHSNFGDFWVAPRPTFDAASQATRTEASPTPVAKNVKIPSILFLISANFVFQNVIVQYNQAIRE